MQRSQPLFSSTGGFMPTDRTEMRPLGRLLLVAGFVAFVAAIVVHYRFSLAGVVRDVVLYPAAICTGLVVWKSERWVHALAAITVGIPAWAFFEVAALTERGETRPFVNHVLLLVAAAFAAAGRRGVRAQGRMMESGYAL